MSLDSTDLLNRRHIRDSMKDGKLLTSYPHIHERELEFGDIILYRNSLNERTREILRRECSDNNDLDVLINCSGKVETDMVIKSIVEPEKEMATESEVVLQSDSGSISMGSDNRSCSVEDTTIVIVTYGNGVPTSLEAIDRYYERLSLSLTSSSSSSSSSSFKSDSLHDRSLDELPISVTSGKKRSNREIITLVDCPCISTFPTQLRTFLLSCPSLHSVIFADVCKLNAGMPLSMFAMTLQNEGIFAPHKNITWLAIGGANTYNPLGGTLTFLNCDDVTEAITVMIDRKTK